tara:strand:+ start:104 stop:280 length:177 start_codon:yes stop_codon:yes gene_type:complete
MKLIWQIKMLVALIFPRVSLLARVDRTWQQKPQLNISGIADLIYVYDFNQPKGTKWHS